MRAGAAKELARAAYICQAMGLADRLDLILDTGSDGLDGLRKSCGAGQEGVRDCFVREVAGCMRAVLHGWEDKGRTCTALSLRPIICPFLFVISLTLHPHTLYFDSTCAGRKYASHFNYPRCLWLGHAQPSKGCSVIARASAG